MHPPRFLSFTSSALALLTMTLPFTAPFAAFAAGKDPGPVIFNPANVPEPTRTYVAELKALAQRENIAHERAWLLLGHWRPQTFGGFKTEIDGLSFFLAAKGAGDPAAELEATLDAFSQPSDLVAENQHAQCRYPARRAYLYQRLAIDRRRLPWNPCPRIEEWKKKLDAEAVSLVFASAYLNNAASMFGHTFFKFHSRSNAADRDLLNYGVNFAAGTGDDGGAAFAVRGLFGGYRGYFSMLPYHQTLRQYANLEGRDIWEYKLALAPEELERLIDHLLELEQTWFDYYFFDENCSYQLLAALEVARPSLHLLDRFAYFVIPADAVRVVAREPNLVGKISYRPSLAAEFKERLKPLSGGQRRLARALVRADDFSKPEKRLAAETAEAQERVLDAALLYSGILSGSNADAYRDRDYRLKIARARLGTNSRPIDAAEIGATRPEEGHDSSLVAIGYGRRDASDYQLFAARAAYHALLSRDAGFLPNTRLEAFRAEVRRDSAPEAYRLHEFEVLDLLAVTPWTVFQRPLSWTADLGWRRQDDRPEGSSLAFAVNGGVGAAFQPFGSAFTLAAFGLAHFDAADDLGRGFRLGGSGRLQGILRLASGWHVGAGAEYAYFVWGERSEFPTFWARQTIALSRDWEFRLEHRRAADIVENQAAVAWQFLF